MDGRVCTTKFRSFWFIITIKKNQAKKKEIPWNARKKEKSDDEIILEFERKKNVLSVRDIIRG
jgi:hypothetical protein